jgi:PAS domain S-box-containing protein
MNRSRWLPVVVAIAASLVPGALRAQVLAEPPRTQTRVLTLYALSPGAPFYTISEQVFRRVLGAGFNDQVDYYSEVIDFHRFSDPSYWPDFEEYLVRKYQARPIDLLIATGGSETAFAVRLRERIASRPPIVFSGWRDERIIPESTGHFYRFPMKESLDLALRVHPDTRQVFVVVGASAGDRWYEGQFRSLVPTPPGVQFTYLSGLSMSALSDRLASLPERSIVFLASYSGDPDGRNFLTASSSELLAAASRAPIYTWNANYPGTFGGRLLSTEKLAEKTAALALRVLRGERPEDIPITSGDVSFDALDWRQLDRWNVSEARVPPGVELMFRETGIFTQYRGYILSALALLLLQTALIAGLLIQRRNKRVAENSLRESEERFRVMADTAPVMIWRSDSDQQCDFFNKPWLEFRGRSLREEIGDGWTEGVHPEDLDRCLTVYAGAHPGHQSFRMEYRLRRADGRYRWVLDSGVPRLAPDGAFLGYIGSCIDITERRDAEGTLLASEAALRQKHAEIQDLAGRLITAQEAERARIARELHDDVSQQLAAISIAISECRRRPETQASADLLEALAAIRGQTVGLAEDIRLLSHDIHPSALKHSSLPDALRSHCREFAQQLSIRVAVEADDDLAVSDMETALCLYRIAQEALRNIAKHAHARQVQVTVRQVDDELRLTVTDDGKGFDLATVQQRAGGLGLRSIEERVRLVGGHLSIETAPDQGTRITVWMRTPAAVGRSEHGDATVNDVASWGEKLHGAHSAHSPQA